MDNVSTQRVKFVASTTDFMKVSGCPIAYWANKSIFNDFEKFDKMDSICEIRNGITTGDNGRFLRFWFEIDRNSNRWIKCNKGGAFRRWEGNNEYVIDWENDGYRLKHFFDDSGKLRATLRGIDMNFTAGVTMSRVTSSMPSFREMTEDSISESATNAIYPKDNNRDTSLKVMALLNSKIGIYILDLVNPTINVVPEDLRSFPVCFGDLSLDIVDENVTLSKADWDSFETSLDFKKHPLI